MVDHPIPETFIGQQHTGYFVTFAYQNPVGIIGYGPVTGGPDKLRMLWFSQALGGMEVKGSGVWCITGDYTTDYR